MADPPPPSKKLSYEALKAVIKHFDNEYRLKASFQMPGIRTAERGTPMKFKSLRFERSEFVIDGTSYDLGIICESKTGEPIHPHLDDQNKMGGCKLELDEYGQEIGDPEHTLLPGDLNIWERDRPKEEYIRNDYSFRYIHHPSPSPHYEIPSYDQFIQLTITKPTGGKSIVKVPYTIPLYEATKRIMNFVFGGRACLEVERFEVAHLRRLVLRVPVGFKMKVADLAIGGDLPSLFQSIHPMLDCTSFPLRTLELNRLVMAQNGFLEIIKHPVLQQAQNLVVRYLVHEDQENTSLAKIPLKRLDVKTYHGDEVQYLSLVNVWRRAELPIGTLYSFGTCAEIVDEVLRLAQIRFNGITISERCLALPMSYTAEIHLHYEIDMKRAHAEPKYILKFEVVESQGANRFYL